MEIFRNYVINHPRGGFVPILEDDDTMARSVDDAKKFYKGEAWDYVIKNKLEGAVILTIDPEDKSFANQSIKISEKILNE